ncbi:SigE family RNA polymerase sigma factor [Flindersiella endophytica]
MAKDAFDDFVRARWLATMRLAYGMTLDRGRAEDLAQDAFAKLWFRWGKASAGNPEAYLRKILVSLFLSRRRLRWWSESPAAELPEPAGKSGTGRVDDRDALRRALATLSPRQRAAVYLRYAEDLPEREVAELLGCSTGAVKTHASRGLEALRRNGALADSSALTREGTDHAI